MAVVVAVVVSGASASAVDGCDTWTARAATGVIATAPAEYVEVTCAGCWLAIARAAG